MDLHPGEDVVFEGHPSWRALLSYYLSGVVGSLVVAAIVALATSVGLGALVAVALIALVLVVGFVRRMATTYMVSNQRLYIRRGVLSKHVQQTRIDRVQNVNTGQSLLERILRVGTVDFDTAGTDDSDFRFVGLASPSRVVAAVDRAQREAALGSHPSSGLDAPRGPSAWVPAATSHPDEVRALVRLGPHQLALLNHPAAYARLRGWLAR